MQSAHSRYFHQIFFNIAETAHVKEMGNFDFFFTLPSNVLLAMCDARKWFIFAPAPYHIQLAKKILNDSISRRVPSHITRLQFNPLMPKQSVWILSSGGLSTASMPLCRNSMCLFRQEPTYIPTSSIYRVIKEWGPGVLWDWEGPTVEKEGAQ